MSNSIQLACGYHGREMMKIKRGFEHLNMMAVKSQITSLGSKLIDLKFELHSGD